MTHSQDGQPAGLIASPAQALAELQAGNARFVTGTAVHPHQDAARRVALAQSQAPFAVTFSCSDSRIGAEIIFDRGLGDLFAVRTVGHTVGPEALASIEFAVTALDTPLVVVLGHSSCGAVRAAYDAHAAGSTPAGHLPTVVDAILPSVRLAAEQHVTDIDRIVERNVERVVDQLLTRSALVAAAVAAGRCAVVGMSYQLDTGQVGMVTTGAGLDGAESNAAR